MKLEWGKKVSCPACAMHLYDLMRNPIVCPYCGNIFEPDYKLKKKSSLVDESAKVTQEFEFEEDNLTEDDSAVLEGDDLESDIDVIKIKEFDE